MKAYVLQIVAVVAALVLWEYAGLSNSTVRLLISSPSHVGGYFWANRTDLLAATGITALEAFVGLVIATACSLSLGVICLYFPRLVDLILPALVSIQVIPLVVFAPFVILVFGIGLASKSALAALIAFFPLFLNFFRGYQSISINIHDLLDIYETNRSFRIFHVFIPLAAPSIFSGLKVSATLAVLGAIVAEFTGASVGIGKNIFLTTIRIEPELMVLSVALSACIGGALYLMVDRLERVLGAWYL